MSDAELALLVSLVLLAEVVVPVLEAAVVVSAAEAAVVLLVLELVLPEAAVLEVSVLEELEEAYSGWYLKMTLCC